MLRRLISTVILVAGTHLGGVALAQTTLGQTGSSQDAETEPPAMLVADRVFISRFGDNSHNTFRI